MKFTLCRDKVVVYLESLKKFATFPKDNEEFSNVYAYIMKPEATEAGFLEIFLDVADKFIQKYTDGDIKEEDNGKIFMNGLEIPDNILSKINELRKAGYSWKQHQKFWARCLLNPRKESIVDLFRFIENNNLVITEEGNFLGYKAITRYFKDKHTQTISNKVGETVTMNREDVTFDPKEACSCGLHVACYSYARGFMSLYSGDRLVIVEVDPKDVVSVPYDSASQKIRVCRYKVIKEVIPDDPELRTGVVTVDNNTSKVVLTADTPEKKEIKAGKTWTKVEIAALKTACLNSLRLNKEGKISWVKLSALFPGRTPEAIRRQWSKLKKEALEEVRRPRMKKSVEKRVIPAPKVPNMTGRKWSDKSEKNLCKVFMEWCGSVNDFYKYYAKKCGRTPKAVARKLEDLRNKQKAQLSGLL